MKTQGEIDFESKATEFAMQHVFSGYKDLSDYDILSECAENDGGNPPSNLTAWEPFENKNAEDLLEIVDNLAELFVCAMNWARYQYKRR